MNRRKGSPRLPWKRGPVAWEIVLKQEEIRGRLTGEGRHFFSLRRTARILGVSVQPVRDWVKRGYLNPTGKRRLFEKGEVSRFLDWLCKRATPFDREQYLERIYRNKIRPFFPFGKLMSSRIIWPKGRLALNPRELSALVGCHPSLIVKAIQTHEVRGQRKTNHRWEITRRAWSDRFPTSIQRGPHFPTLPTKDLIPTREVAHHLLAYGLPATSGRVRTLIRNGALAAVKAPTDQRKFLVKRESLEDFCRILQKPA